MWRKSRTPHNYFCYGADINRNFDFHWGGQLFSFLSLLPKQINIMIKKTIDTIFSYRKWIVFIPMLRNVPWTACQFGGRNRCHFEFLATFPKHQAVPELPCLRTISSFPVWFCKAIGTQPRWFGILLFVYLNFFFWCWNIWPALICFYIIIIVESNSKQYCSSTQPAFWNPIHIRKYCTHALLVHIHIYLFEGISRLHRLHTISKINFNFEIIERRGWRGGTSQQLR